VIAESEWNANSTAGNSEIAVVKEAV